MGIEGPTTPGLMKFSSPVPFLRVSAHGVIDGTQRETILGDSTTVAPGAYSFQINLPSPPGIIQMEKMKYRSTIAIATCLIMAVCSLVPVIAGNSNNVRSRSGNNDSTIVLSQEEVDDLCFMREEEKLARDVYLKQYTDWRNLIFYNISLSEQSHTDAVLALLEKYRLEDSARPEVGVFNNTELQDLYDMLTQRAETSELEALMVGALIEEVDMEDIVDAMERTERSDILNVYGHLLEGSTHHLIAFVSVIEDRTGVPYQAQHLPQEVVDEILGRL